jgi:adenylylsulfate kinase
MNKLLWITSPSGGGKTTIAQKVQNFVDCIHLDGDSMRRSISKDEGFTPDDRLKHNLRVARLAKELVKQKNVIVTLIAPDNTIRGAVDGVCNPIWVYLKRNVPERENHYYIEPDNAIVISNQNRAVEDVAADVVNIFNDDKPVYSLFIGRWQCLPPHSGHMALFDTVRKEGSNILIAIRDTAVDEKNPYSVNERIRGLSEAVPDAKLIVIPDISEVCYGRGVGYDIREIVLDDETQAISGTQMRKEGLG